MKNKSLFGSIILLVTSIVWGVAFVFQRTGMDSIEPITFNAVRMGAGAIFLIIICIIKDIFARKKASTNNENNKISIKSTILGGLGCGLFLSAASIVQQIGLVYTSAGKAGFITAMYMLFVPIINLVLFKKRGTARLWVAVALGIVGTYLLCVKEDFSFTEGDILILACALLFSGHILWCDKFAPKSDPLKFSAIQFITATLISTIFAFALETPTVEKIVSAAIPILYCGLVSGGIGYTLQIIGQRHTEPTAASIIMSLEAVFAAIAGALMLNEKMNINEFIGCVIMFAAIILIQIPEKSKVSSSNQ